MKFVPSIVTQKFGRQILQLQKVSPQIAFGVGIAGVVTSTVLACKATLKIDEALDSTATKRRDMDRALDNPAMPDYGQKQHASDVRLLRVHIARDMTKLYGPAVVVGVVSIGLLTGSHVVLNRRNAGLTAAYAAVEKAFDEYRSRVREDLGEDRDREFRYGKREVEEVVQGKNGPKTRKSSAVDDTIRPSGYARFFDELCDPWQPQAEYNAIYLKGQQSHFNNMLHARGHVFLNEVYDALGLPRSKAGQVVGWVIGKGDQHVDFGIFDDAQNPNVRDFVNGREASILLDFNVAGPIYDLI